MKSYVTRNNGAKCLWVYYNRHLDNFEEAIENALAEHGLKHGETTVIALPETPETEASNS